VELYDRPAHELTPLLQARKLSARELAEAVFARIEAVEPRVMAYVTLTRDPALQQAAQVDEARVRGDALHPLAGVPLALKDNLCTIGVETTCSSKILRGFVPPYDATVVRKAREAQCVFTGKTNLDEFAMGSSTENSAFFTTHNPWDLSTVPGGSSGGSAAAVAAGETIMALGSDTGGSIRQPAALCGVVGLKPTYGLVSRYGLIAFASSLDQIGPITRDVTDAALLMNLISGHDPLDSTSIDLAAPDFTKCLDGNVRGLRAGIAKEYFGEGIEQGVRERVNGAIEVLESLGVRCEEVSLPHTEYALPTYYLLAPAEASSNLARYDGVRYGHRTKEPVRNIVEMFMKTRDEGFGAEVKLRIMLGTFGLSAGYFDAYYLKALRVRTLIKRDFDRAFERFDVLLSPTSPTVAFKIGERVGDPMAMKMADICTIPVNLAGICAISVPCGLSNGLPVGLQIMGKPLGEETVLRVAHAYEQAAGHRALRPSI
jgi:aspartyl-tRNA(Asn)/glutamyl-tRNA(Gln) amidotransferase subunit A